MLTFVDLLDDMASSLDQPRVELLVLLIDRLRPASSRDVDDTQSRFKRLLETLNASPMRRQVLHDYVLTLMGQFHQVSLYADSGMLGNEGFFQAMRQRMTRRMLPPLRQPNQLRDVFAQCFNKPSDAYWVAQISADDWSALWRLFANPNHRADLRRESRSRVLSALMLVSYRITAISLEPELTRAYPAINEFKSPFLAQNRDIIDYVEAEKARINDYANAASLVSDVLLDPQQALVMLDQCRDIVQRVKRTTRKQGVSITLTNLLTRLEQNLERMDLLLNMLNHDPARVYAALGELMRTVTQAQQDQHSVRALVSANTELLSRQVTENASQRGEHYVRTDRQGFWRMYRSAAGAGLIIASMATLKVLTGRLVLAPFSRAVLYSMNYSFGFMLIHVLQFTVATKQPAMTAAALAATVQYSSGSRQTQLLDLTQLIVNIMRTQFIAIVGNISVAMPTGLLIAWLWQWKWHEPLLSASKAVQTLHDIHPFESLALFYAAIAGVWLFVAGLISGYYDNLAIYHQVGPRLRQHVRLQQWLGQNRLNRVSVYIEQNLGSLAGNFWFGIFLGSTGTLGYILGLPIDIRHIAFASANFMQALFCLESPPSLGLVLISFLGVLMIGMTNLMVSFGLTLFVALRARRVQYAQWRPLLQLLMAHFATRPSDFFWPPKQSVNAPHPRDQTRS